MSRKKKEQVGIAFEREQLKKIEEILANLNRSPGVAGSKVSRSEIVRELVAQALEDMAMGDHTRTMREALTSATDEDQKSEKASRRGRGNLRKGKTFEREVATEINERLEGADAKRGLQYRGGENVPDVEAPLFHIECKRGKRPNPRAALSQAVNDCAKGKIPIAVIRDDRSDPFVVLLWSDFLDFYEEWWSRQ